MEPPLTKTYKVQTT